MEASNYIRPVHSPPDPVCVCLCFTPALLFAYFLLISDWFENTFWPPICAFLSSLFVYFVTIFSTLCEIFYFDLVCAFYLISVLSASVLIGLVFPLSPACHRVPFVSLPPTRLAWPCCCLLPLRLPICVVRLCPFLLLLHLPVCAVRLCVLFYFCSVCLCFDPTRISVYRRPVAMSALFPRCPLPLLHPVVILCHFAFLSVLSNSVHFS